MASLPALNSSRLNGFICVLVVVLNCAAMEVLPYSLYFGNIAFVKDYTRLMNTRRTIQEADSYRGLPSRSRAMSMLGVRAGHCRYQ